MKLFMQVFKNDILQLYYAVQLNFIQCTEFEEWLFYTNSVWYPMSSTFPSFLKKVTVLLRTTVYIGEKKIPLPIFLCC